MVSPKSMRIVFVRCDCISIHVFVYKLKQSALYIYPLVIFFAWANMCLNIVVGDYN